MYSYRRIEPKSEAWRGFNNLKHDLRVLDVYASLRSSGIIMEWLPKVSLPQLGKNKQGRLMFPDAGFLAFGKRFYIEEETGSQDIDDIELKVNNYIDRKEQCFVIFFINDYQPNPLEPIRKTARDFGNEILLLLKEKGRRNQFTATPHDTFIVNPLAEVLVSPLVQRFSLESIS
jgi:hypothetical protein